MVLYRKYRPQTLSDLIGQDVVKKTLLDAFATNKLSHAYLFVGPRGTGKTSTARILAKMINCKEKTPPCNKCDTCISITDGSNLDLIEIDAASNRGIDDVRSLRENIKLSPSGAGKKVYIIDEVHMLTTEAFNALLKTLEEPPEHVIFILATTEANKIPATILSRVTRVDFKRAKPVDIIKSLQLVAKGEGLEIETEALNLLAKKADGSFRDGVKLLDQLSGTGKITIKDVSDNLAVSPFEGVIEILNSLSKRDTAKVLIGINTQLENGAGTRELTLQLMETLRNLVLLKNGLTEIVKEDLGRDSFEIVKNLADSFDVTDLSYILNKLQESFEKLKFVSIPSLPLELCMVEVCGVNMGPVSALSGHEAPLGTPKSETFSSSPDLVMGLSRDGESAPETSPIASLPQISANPPISIVTPSAPSSDEAILLQEKWTFILESIRPYNFSLEALLRSVKIASAEGGVVILEVPYSFHQRILEAPKSKDLLESVMSEVLQKPTKVTTTIGVRPERIEDLANVEVAADDEIITMAADIFNGKLV